MKNFTLAAAGLAMAMTATAGLNVSKAPIALQQQPQARTNFTSLFNGDVKAQANVASELAKRAKGMKAPSAAAIEGDYTYVLGDWYFQTSQMDFIESEGTISFEGEFCVLDCKDFPGLPFVGQYDESNGNIDFFAINFGQIDFQGGAKYYVVAEPFYWDNDAQDIIPYEYSVAYDEASNGFVFPADHGVMWEAYSDANLKNFAGYLWICDVASVLKSGPAGDPNEGWTDYDTANYVDGWMMPAFGVDPEDYAWNVSVQQNNENPWLFRIDNPYLAPDCPLAEDPAAYGVSEGGYIVFNLEDPDHVEVVAGVWNGIKNGNAKVDNTNMLGYYIQNLLGQKDEQGYEITYEDIVYALEQNGAEFSIYDNSDGSVYFQECGIQQNGNGFYSWQDQAGNSVADMMYGYLIFDNLIPDGTQTKVAAAVAEECAAEYFNLQGVRVANPEAGQLVIKRQGEKASKIIVK